MNTDLNNLFTEGYWLRTGGTTVTNAPFNAVLGFTIFVRKEAENSGSTFYTQTLSAGDGKMYKRVYWGSTGWQAWHSIDSFGYSTLSELANGVLGAFTRDVDIPSASFIYGNKSTTSTDLNEINTTGLYEITGKSYTNAPLSTTINGGILSVQARLSDGYQTVIQTLAIANGIYMRSRINGSWSSWKQL